MGSSACAGCCWIAERDVDGREAPGFPRSVLCPDRPVSVPFRVECVGLRPAQVIALVRPKTRGSRLSACPEVGVARNRGAGGCRACTGDRLLVGDLRVWWPGRVFPSPAAVTRSAVPRRPWTVGFYPFDDPSQRSVSRAGPSSLLPVPPGVAACRARGVLLVGGVNGE